MYFLPKCTEYLCSRRWWKNWSQIDHCFCLQGCYNLLENQTKQRMRENWVKYVGIQRREWWLSFHLWNQRRLSSIEAFVYCHLRDEWGLDKWKRQRWVSGRSKSRSQMKEICSLNKIGKARLEEQEYYMSVRFLHIIL